MPETLATDLEIVSLVRRISCDITTRELREKAAASINTLLLKYSASEHPILRQQIEDLKRESEIGIGSSAKWVQVFWFLHIYLCFYAHPETPLHPKTPSEKGFLNYWMYLYQKAKAGQ